MAVVCQRSDDLAKRKQRFVDLNGLLKLDRILRRICRRCMRLTFTASQVNKLQFAYRL